MQSIADYCLTEIRQKKKEPEVPVKVKDEPKTIGKKLSFVSCRPEFIDFNNNTQLLFKKNGKTLDL